MGKLLRGQHGEDVALILFGIRRLLHETPAAAFPDSGIMSGRDGIVSGIDGAVEQKAELDMPVADDAGIGGQTVGIRIGEIVGDVLPERSGSVPRRVRQSQRIADPPCVRGILLLRIGKHGQRHAHAVSGVAQEESRRAAVHAAAHGYDISLPCGAVIVLYHTCTCFLRDWSRG